MFASGICGNGMGGGMFSVREMDTDSTKTTFDIDWMIIWVGGFFCS